jgi:hypothetical protein
MYCLLLQGPPSLRQFDADEFIKSLDQAGPNLTSGVKGDWEGLYRKFFRSPNFEGWLYHRQFEVNQKLQVLHMEALCQAVSHMIRYMIRFIDLNIAEKFPLNHLNFAE